MYLNKGLLPGSAHWLIEVLRLLIGIGGMILAVQLAAFIKRRVEVGSGGSRTLKSRRVAQSMIMESR